MLFTEAAAAAVCAGASAPALATEDGAAWAPYSEVVESEVRPMSSAPGREPLGREAANKLDAEAGGTPRPGLCGFGDGGPAAAAAAPGVVLQALQLKGGPSAEWRW